MSTEKVSTAQGYLREWINKGLGRGCDPGDRKEKEGEGVKGKGEGEGCALRKAEVRCQRLEASEGCALAREYFYRLLG